MSSPLLAEVVDQVVDDFAGYKALEDVENSSSPPLSFGR